MNPSRYQREADEWISQYKEGYWEPFEILAALSEEIGELGRELNYRFGPKPKKEEELEVETGEELADVVFRAMCLANSHELELEGLYRALHANKIESLQELTEPLEVYGKLVESQGNIASTLYMDPEIAPSMLEGEIVDFLITCDYLTEILDINLDHYWNKTVKKCYERDGDRFEKK